MKPPYTSEEIHALYMAHLERCDRCNYDKPCMQCEVGILEEETEPIIAVTGHACNCPWGTGLGATLERLERMFKTQAEVKALEQNLNSLQGNITMLGIYLSWVKVE
jgi:hypothetical protein